MTRVTFARDRRLTEAKEFSRVFASASRSSDLYFTVLCRSSQTDRARLGLTIPRRAAKRAVDRNRLKRIVREYFRRQTLPALDFVVMAKGSAAAADSATLRRSLEAHFRRLGSRNGSSN